MEKKVGVSDNMSFIVKENAPIINIKGNNFDESDSKLVKGTVFDGKIKTRIINIDGEKQPYKIIQLSNGKGYISPDVVNGYIGTFANLDGLNPADNTPVKKYALGEHKKAGQKQKLKSTIINYALPITGGVIGYKIAKKMNAEMKKTVGYVIFFGLLGSIPRYLYRNK